MEIAGDEDSVHLRRMLCEQGSLSKSVGSSTFAQGDTVINSGVYGPSEIRLDKEGNLEANLEIVYHSKSGQSGCYEKLVETLIKNTCKSIIILSQYPRSNIGIIIYEMQLGGSPISCSCNAACLALIDAGISLKCLTAAVSCIITTDDQIIVDPTSAQEKEGKATMFFAFDSQNFNVITCYTRGVFKQEKYQECLSICRNASKSIFDFYQDAVKRKLSKS